MGTRSITRVFESAREIACIYCQWDGHIESLGVDIAQFINSRVFVNGIPGDREKYFNGMGCFAAALVWHLKKGEDNKAEAGNVYLTTYGDGDHGQEYEYIVRGETGLDDISVEVIAYRESRFKGSIVAFLAFCENPPEDEEDDEE